MLVMNYITTSEAKHPSLKLLQVILVLNWPKSFVEFWLAKYVLVRLILKFIIYPEPHISKKHLNLSVSTITYPRFRKNGRDTEERSIFPAEQLTIWITQLIPL